MSEKQNPSLKRVKQYFLTRPQVGKVARMVAEIRDFDIIETNSEKGVAPFGDLLDP